jgi:hypothetical protein
MDRALPDAAAPHAEMTVDCDCKSALPKINRALSYWNEKRQNRAMPARRDISPFEIKDVLPIVQFYDVVDGGASYRVRLLGTDVARLFDKDPTGKLFDRGSDSKLVTRMLTIFDQVMSKRKPLIARAEHTAIEKVNHSPIESIYCPLSDDGTDINMIFAATVVLAPYRTPQLVE